MTSHYGACDCCGKEGQELSFSESYGIETWACGECCCDPAPRHFATAMSEPDAMPADVMDQIRRSMGRMAVVRGATNADVPAAVVFEELNKIFAAYEREPAASDPCVKMRAIWGIP